MGDQILHYRSVLAYNREVFLVEHGELIKTFSDIDGNFSALVDIPQTMRDADGHSYESLIPFLLLLQRQSRAAFESFAIYQSYQGWVVLRPGIEAVLIVGKWVDDASNAKVWQNRKQDWKAYQKIYSRRALESKSLPSSKSIQGVLSKVNDDFVHANPDYYGRHLKLDTDDPDYGNFLLNYFDDSAVHQAHVFAFLHLLLVMQQALSDLLGHLFSSPVRLKYSLSEFKLKFGVRITELSSASNESAVILDQLGLWQTGDTAPEPTTSGIT